METDKLEFVQRLEENRVRFVRVLFTNLLGELRSIEIPVNRLEEAVENGVSFDGSSIGGYAHVANSDMYLKPDLETLMVYPCLTTGHGGGDYTDAGVIGDVYTSSGEPFAGDSRSVLKRFMKQAAEEKIELFTGAEPEFFLFPEGEIPTDPGQISSKAGYFSLSPVDIEEAVRKEIVLALLQMEISVEASHHEIAPHIHEIDFKYADPLTTADQLMVIKFVAKTVARLNGLQAVFMPKPIAEFAASGMHLHLSLFRDGENAFYDPQDGMGLSQDARSFIGGLFEHLGAIMALTNPTINSYKRLVPGYEAPVNIAWARKNRSALIRIPATNTPVNSTRIELRSPDPSANPYLAFTAIFAAGIDGIERCIEPPQPVEEDIYRMSKEEKAQRGIKPVPGSLDQTIEELESDEVIRQALGPEASEYLIRAKRAEIAAFNRAVTDWERQQYLDV